ncbi:MAG: dihydrouridine synthase [Candidatus Taylorbacteria bacterium CG11_big_fil_rev_8_21_14_0_20_46_11]|uniref:tRNA-dihydrouridine synthase n=1 Tax=Candidatus Taylorbacteria bacterium CG11_big_fil_rev_8_21_14_0_20_46_11 TaxID=1975025 RepID=A0A2H0KCG9_9BACT|nr:MAG: dihydrouridine synthase [Candidatus Taylorbacteria bacterium CG11_big_fil_rev_8_21_14_0_20_46_11]
MNLGFWGKLQKPILVLAPMADVTDVAFRRVIASCGRPDVMWTEFVSADGLVHPQGQKKLLIDLSYTPAERPIVAQLFSGRPEKMYEGAKIVKELGFDGLDINMGCPDRGIEKSGAGASLIKKPALAREIIRVAKEGMGDLPVSVKTRLGYNKDTLEEWLPELLAEKPAVVTMHARTRKEMSDVPARWNRIEDAVDIRNKLNSETLIFGNGDVMSLADARKKAKETGADGIMLGRAIFGNPWLFGETHKQKINESDINPLLVDRFVAQRLGVLIEHTKLFEELLGEHKNFAIMKKHFKAYVEGFVGAKDLRVKLMEARDAKDVEDTITQFLRTFVCN